LESACFNYHCLPYDGGIFDQPLYLMEAFNIIRSTKNRYENKNIEEITKNMNKDSGSKPQVMPKKMFKR
jgi:hypothetical protein